MIKLEGSFVAMPTPFTADDKIDFNGFETLINRQIKYGTSQIFILGSAGETTLLSVEEKKAIVKEVVAMTRGKIPVFFGAASTTTDGAIEMAKYCEEQGADGVIFTVPPYVLVSQHAALNHLDACMSSIGIPCGIYNNPSRLGVHLTPETIKTLSDKHPHFVLDKEAMGDCSQLVQVQAQCQGKVKIMCCDFPKYSIVIPTLALGGTGTANIGGNIIPEESAHYSRPWTSMQIMEECRKEYTHWFPLLKMLYTFSNPVCIKAALDILGLPGGHLRRPYEPFTGKGRDELERLMGEMGVIDKYGVR